MHYFARRRDIVRCSRRGCTMLRVVSDCPGVETERNEAHRCEKEHRNDESSTRRTCDKGHRDRRTDDPARSVSIGSWEEGALHVVVETKFQVIVVSISFHSGESELNEVRVWNKGLAERIRRTMLEGSMGSRRVGCISPGYGESKRTLIWNSCSS